jgi:hypothetical protein
MKSKDMEGSSHGLITGTLYTFFLKALSKIMKKKLSQDSRSSIQDLNPGTHKYEGVSFTWPRGSTRALGYKVFLNFFMLVLEHMPKIAVLLITARRTWDFVICFLLNHQTLLFRIYPTNISYPNKGFNVFGQFLRGNLIWRVLSSEIQCR